jgi:hypothetical protein
MKSLSFGHGSVSLGVAALFCIAMLHPHRAAADGALAVGVPKDVAKQGFAYAYSTDKADSDAARAEALETCRKPGDNKSARALLGGWNLHQAMRRGGDGPGERDAGRRLGDRIQSEGG